ncbi:glutamate ABC transporter substrate-binding protein [Corynebacterium massiliense]|uniref:ABC transporter glutamine-binding protein GlnH n=1 Tax=Corynebacterium massiliense DSM 45435 TaxID=1121364 RepID=A0ABY7UAJ2_9CORY|nr:glutamate ABC transporter substrate-binding protein [Corynebacterium massiliense]WCZ33273.1 ABC transporter glutamine-binding protein GlnH precursor [Corynebacterium massiliense DSM 45435]
MPTRFRPLAAVVTAATLTATLAGCASPLPHKAAPEATDRINDLRRNHSELPAGAELEAAGTQEGHVPDVDGAEPSWRPSVENDAGTKNDAGTENEADRNTPEGRVPDIVKRGRLIVGVDPSLNLLSFREGATGELRGFEIDLAREIARDIFGDPDKVDFKFLNTSGPEDAIDSGQVDLLLRNTSITPERQEDMAFSIPYLRADIRLLTNVDSPITAARETAGRTVCASRDSTPVDQARKDTPMANILITRSWSDCLMAIQEGQADAVITDDTILSGMVAQDPYTHIVGEALNTSYYGAVIPKPTRAHDTRGLIRQVNSTIERVRDDDTLHHLHDKWFGPYLDYQPLPAPQYYPADKEPALARDSQRTRDAVIKEADRG